MTTSPSTQPEGPVGHRILLVEDDATAREALAGLLREQGYEVVTAVDGAQALNLLDADTPDLVLTDMVMPTLGALGVIRTMRADTRLDDVPVIVMSAQHATYNRVEAFDAGADDFVPKPVEIDELMARVRRQLQRSEHHKETVRQSVVDALTGVFNRRGISNFFVREHERTEREGSPLSILLIDVDDFKAVNDQYGHAAGDMVLCALARALQDVLRATDRVGRVGGDEFLAVLPGASADDLAELVTRVRNMPMVLDVGGAELRPKLSIGAVSADPGERLEPLLARADAAMYADKRLHKLRRRA